MKEKSSAPHAYVPETLGQTLSLLKREPEALLLAGGTYILTRDKGKNTPLPGTIISLGNVEELQRIGRTDQFLEIGACVPISHILTLGKNILPRILNRALEQLATPIIKNRATLGGNICISEQRMDAYPVLQLLNAMIELKNSSSSRWLPINKLIDEKGTILFKEGELLTRMRIPFEQWDIQEYRKIGSVRNRDGTQLSFCALARTQKEVINDFTFAFGSIGPTPLRDRIIEAELSGKKLPLSDREQKYILSLLQKTVEKRPGQITEFQKTRIQQLMKHFLMRLSVE